jgi:hypothetical protein
MSDKKVIPEVNEQMLIDSGLNAFGLKLFIESITSKEDVKTFKPLTFIYKGVEITLKPAGEINVR